MHGDEPCHTGSGIDSGAWRDVRSLRRCHVAFTYRAPQAVVADTRRVPSDRRAAPLAHWRRRADLGALAGREVARHRRRLDRHRDHEGEGRDTPSSTSVVPSPDPCASALTARGQHLEFTAQLPNFTHRTATLSACLRSAGPWHRPRSSVGIAGHRTCIRERRGRDHYRYPRRGSSTSRFARRALGPGLEVRGSHTGPEEIWLPARKRQPLKRIEPLE